MKPDPHAPIDCASARPLIDAYLLGALDAPSGSALQAHIAGCPTCSVELRGFAGLLELLATMPLPSATPGFDERLILAAIAERQRRHEHRSWLGDLPRVIFRGAMRTTGTLILTLVSVALLSSALVFAAGNFFARTALVPTPGATVVPEVTPTLAPTPLQTAVPTSAPIETQRPVVVSVTPASTPDSASTLEPALTPAATVEPVPTLAATPVPEPTLAPTPTPIPTEKPRRTPPPSPADTPAPTADVTPSP